MVAPFEFNPAELTVLATACRQADDLAALEELIRQQGMTIEGSTGRQRLNPALTEVRQGRVVLAKLLDALAIPDEAGRPDTLASRRARHAAESRWRTHQERTGRGPA